MNDLLPDHLQRWQRAGLLDENQAARILAFEAGRPPSGLALPGLLAIACGALLVSAGTLLLVGAHWDHLGPWARFAWVLAPVALFHLAGAWAARGTPGLATALHGVGTALLGPGLFLTAWSFSLQEHEPLTLLFWTLGAWAGLALRRDWVQGLLAALVTPWWLGAEWVEASRLGTASVAPGAGALLAVGAMVLATTYFTLRRRDGEAPLLKALAWLGGLALLPAAVILAAVRPASGYPWGGLPWPLAALGWAVALGGPLALAVAVRRRAAWANAVAALWAVVLPLLHGWGSYAWCALGAAGLVGWGLLEARRERVDLGMAGFALTVSAFYWSNVMGKLGRSLGLLGLGLLFLAGGWLLEWLRRRLQTALGTGSTR
jgi:hypothetical protein